jgi:hypothetical protein
MPTPYDYSDVPKSTAIPRDTIATIAMHINAGGVGEDGMLTRSKDGACEMLNATFTLLDGEHAKRKFFQNFVLAGTTDGHAQAAEISLRTLRAILESARGIMPDDVSPEARALRTASLKDFDRLNFMAKLGVEKGDGNYPDKNFIASVITPDRKEWHPVEQPPPFNGGSGAASSSTPPQTPPPQSAPPIQRPGWASS